MASQHSFPIEVITRILSFALASPSDDPQKPPSPRPHPVSVLLVSNEITRALLPEFYCSINVFKPMDWYTLFNTEFGILAVDESDKPRSERRFPPLSIRQRWVRELFLGITAHGHPVDHPFDVYKVIDSTFLAISPIHNLSEYIEGQLPRYLQCHRLLEDTCPLDLPNLHTLVALPLPGSFPDPDLSILLDAFADHIDAVGWFRNPALGQFGFNLEDLNVTSNSAQGEEFNLLDLPAGLTTVHLPIDHAFMRTNWFHSFGAIRTIYARARNAEVFTYLPHEKLEMFNDWTALDFLVHLLLGAPEGSNRPAEPRNKNVVLVGSRGEVQVLFEGGMNYEEVDLVKVKGWEWLGPDGKRRSPLAAVQMD